MTFNLRLPVAVLQRLPRPQMTEYGVGWKSRGKSVLHRLLSSLTDAEEAVDTRREKAYSSCIFVVEMMDEN
jgi:hypothetical protein